MREVELWINGVSQGVKTPVGVIAQWENVKLAPGRNHIHVKAEKNPAVVDSCFWYVKDTI